MDPTPGAPWEWDVEGFGGGGFDDTSDGELARLAQQGQMAAFGELYRRNAGSVTSVARSVVSDPEVVADVVQETFRRALERIANLREPDSVGAWLASIARHVATDHLRGLYRTQTEDDSSFSQRAADGPGPDNEAEHRAELDAVNRGIALLSRGDAEALTLCAHLGLSTEELAVALGVSASAAKVRLHRARGRLNRLLEATTPDG